MQIGSISRTNDSEKKVAQDLNLVLQPQLLHLEPGGRLELCCQTNEAIGPSTYQMRTPFLRFADV